MYEEMHCANKIPSLDGIERYFMSNIDDFKKIFDSVTAHECTLPGEWDAKLNEFQKLIVLKAIRPDKCVPAI